jgi:MFS family permease
LSSEAKIEKKPTSLTQKQYRDVGILTTSQFVNNLGFGCVIPVLPIFATDMGLGPSGVGLILSTSAVSRLVLNIPFGRMADTVGRRPLMVGGQLLTAVASFGTAAAGTLPTLLACRLLLGAGGSMAMAGSQAYMADLTSKTPDHRAQIMGFQATIINLAYAVGPAAGGMLCDVYGARSSFLIVGGAALLTSGGFAMLPETRIIDTTGLEKAGGPNETADSDNEASTTSVTKKSGVSKPISLKPIPSVWAVYEPLLRSPDQQGLLAMNFAGTEPCSTACTLLQHTLALSAATSHLSRAPPLPQYSPRTRP